MFILDAVKLAVIQQFRMKECDIFRGSKQTLTPPTYFQGGQDPNAPQHLHPWWKLIQWLLLHFLKAVFSRTCFLSFFVHYLIWVSVECFNILLIGLQKGHSACKTHLQQS